jgi:hypothetical protein
MNVETGTEAVLFPENENINGISVAVYCKGHNLDANLSSKIAWTGATLIWVKQSKCKHFFAALFSLITKTGVLIVYT